MFGRQRFVPMSWMCRKQTEVSHSNAETETISLDAGLRVERTPALLVWDWVMETCSHYSAGRNLMRPSNERHLQFHSDNHMSFDVVYHAPYTNPGHLFRFFFKGQRGGHSHDHKRTKPWFVARFSHPSCSIKLDK